MRLAYVDFDGARTLVAADDVPFDQELNRSFLKLYCPNVVTGIDAMCQWLGE